MLIIEAIGNLGADPEMKYLADGREMTTFSIACNKGKGDDRITSWVNCVVFGKPAETIYNYAKKGDKIFLRGDANPDKETGEPRIWEGKNGTTHATYEMVVKDFEFLGSKKGGE